MHIKKITFSFSSRSRCTKCNIKNYHYYYNNNMGNHSKLIVNNKTMGGEFVPRTKTLNSWRKREQLIKGVNSNNIVLYWNRSRSAVCTRTHPVPHVKEALLVSEVKEQQEAHGVPEERGGQTPKPAFRENRETITRRLSDSSQHVLEQCCQTIFTFMHLADAFIQRDLQSIQIIHVLCVPWESNPQPLSC